MPTSRTKLRARSHLRRYVYGIPGLSAPSLRRATNYLPRTIRDNLRDPSITMLRVASWVYSLLASELEILSLTYGSLETPQYASQGVREQTQELASWALGDSNSLRSGSPNPFHNASASDSDFESRPRRYSDSSHGDGRRSMDSARPDMIKEVSEPQSPEDTGDTTEAQPSALSNLIRHGSPSNGKDSKLLGYGTNSRYSDWDQYSTPSIIVDDGDDDAVTERTTLLPTERFSGRPISGASKRPAGYGQKMEMQFKNHWAKLKYASRDVVKTLSHPRQWDLRQVSSVTIGGVAAVFLGLLLNILDALSYGKLIDELLTALLYANYGEA